MWPIRKRTSTSWWLGSLVKTSKCVSPSMQEWLKRIRSIFRRTSLFGINSLNPKCTNEWLSSLTMTAIFRSVGSAHYWPTNRKYGKSSLTQILKGPLTWSTRLGCQHSITSRDRIGWMNTTKNTSKFFHLSLKSMVLFMGPYSSRRWHPFAMIQKHISSNTSS